MADSLPELVLVHGAWHGAWAWERLLPVLAERGWTAGAVELPSAGSKEGVAADGRALRARLDATPAPKVVVGHSCGGTVITEASAHDTVIGLAYICAARPDVGDIVWKDPHSPEEVPYWIRVDDAEEACFAEDSKKILYNDCSDEVTAAAQARLRGQSLASFLEPVTAAAWRERPYAYLICEIDNCVPAAAQEGLAEGAGHIERLEASHSPFMSRPGDVEEFLRRAVSSF